MAEPKEKDGNYVRSIVAMINEADPASASPPWVSPSRETTPPRNPSYLSVSRSNNGYNNTLLYSVAHRKEPKKDDNHVNGKETKTDSLEYVSLSQMTDSKPKTHSKYSNLGLQLKSPERNCRSFLRNISSFEQISKQSSFAKSPEGSNVTMIGEKMQYLLHLDHTPKTDSRVVKQDEIQPPAQESEAAGTEVSVDVPDRVLVETVEIAERKERFSEAIYQIVGKDEVIETFDAPDGLQAGQYFLGAMNDKKQMLLMVADRIDVEIANNQHIPDEMQGVMRCASGKGNLIVRERFRQFQDLCQTNLCPKPGEMTPGAADLAGFWDMVMIEVCSIFASFREIAKASENDWIIPPKEIASRPNSGQKQKRTRTPNTRRPTSTSNLTKKGPRVAKTIS